MAAPMVATMPLPVPPAPGLAPDRAVRIVGSVRSAVDDAPIEGATVVALEPAGAAVRPLCDGESGADGRFELFLSGGLPAVVELRADADHHAIGVERLELPPVGTPRAVDFRLPRGFTLEVSVSGPDSPLARAELRLRSTLAGFDGELDERTDGDGRATFADVVDFPGHGLRLRVSCEGFHSAEIAPLAADANEPGRPLQVTLERAAPLQGRVVAMATGRPIADADVELFSIAAEDGAAGDEATTDATGAFSVGHDVVPPESALLAVSAEGFQSTRIARPARVAATGRLDVALPEPCRWRGTVVAAGSGAPLAGAEVRALPADLPEDAAEALEVSAVAGGDGTFELELEELPSGGPVRIEVEAAGRAIVTRTVDFGDAAAVAGWPSRFELPASVRIRGRVVRADDGAGVPRARVRLVAGGAAVEPIAGSRTTTGADGAFEWIVAADLWATGGVSLVVEQGRRRHSCGVLAAPPAAGAGELLLPLDLPPPRR
ncbi:MAG: carboxypeptidase regulatory-like domain-containing protein [Planctomycetes bacterium]|nr:carboxypeptidase regulatory-like domain-containing protein [Planctomycetota bacterium]